MFTGQGIPPTLTIYDIAAVGTIFNVCFNVFCKICLLCLGFPAHVLDAGLQPPALHHNNRSATAHHQHHHGSHTPSNSTCSAKRLLSGDQGEYIV